MFNRRQQMTVQAAFLFAALTIWNPQASFAEDQLRPLSNPEAENSKTVRVAAVQTKRRLIDWHLDDPQHVLAAVDQNLIELESLVDKAGRLGCEVLAFPEDTLGLLNWFGVNEQLAKEVLPVAVQRMIERLGAAGRKTRHASRTLQ